MDLQDLHEGFLACSTQEELEDFVRENIKEIRLFFYNKNQAELTEIGQNFENLFYEFKSCPGFKEYEGIGEPNSELIGAMLVFFASIFERINPNPIFTILDLLPKGSVYFRLKAHMCAYEDVNDLTTHYTLHLGQILGLLSKAQYDDEEDYTSLIISFLIRLYKHVVLTLTGHKLMTELDLFCSLFKDHSLTEKYHFLTHPLISKLIDGNIEANEGLAIGETKTSLYYPSDRMMEIFKSDIVEEVKSHPQTRFNEILLGYTAETIRNDIIEYGRADFRTGYDKLSADEKVLLYCYFNMRKHFFTSSFVFEKIYDSLRPVFNDPEKTVVFIDIGCGPLTSGLALADLHTEKTGEKLTINYIGIDISQAMLNKAAQFLKHNIFSEESQSAFYLSWNSIPKATLKKFVGLNNPIVINASYLFASTSLEETELAAFVKDLVIKYHTSDIYFTYQNPNRSDRNQKYLNFKGELIYQAYETNVERVYYKNNPSSYSDPSAEDVYFEILDLKS
jgi:hypothetical protein